MEPGRAAHGVLIAALLLPVMRAEDLAPPMVDGIHRYLVRLTREARALRPDAEALRNAYGIGRPELTRTAIPPAGPKGMVLVLARHRRTNGLRRLGYAAVEQPLFSAASRDRLYRIGFPLGRHPVGLETETALGLLDAMSASGTVEIGIWADAAGREIALCAAALQPRVTWVHVEGEAEPYHTRPLAEDVFGLVRDLGPKGPAALLSGQQIRRVPLPPEAAALERPAEKTEHELLAAIPQLERNRLAAFDPDKTRQRLAAELVGQLPDSSVAPDPRVKALPGGAGFRIFEVRIAVRREFDAAGILLLPGAAAGGRLPLVVVQHGLQDQPQNLYGQQAGRHYDVYRNFAETLVGRGFAVYMPQNPYRGDFRTFSRLAHPLGLTIFSFIRAQSQASLDWLEKHPEIDASRIGFYGLSYGGKTALRIPPLDPRFRVVVCAGDFNEWIRKLVDPTLPYSYLYTDEYELLEWNIARIASHAEMAMLLAPRPFLVERGHRDGVGEDEWVSYEFAKVRRYYDENGWTGRASIAYFNGPHRVDGVEALRWLEQYLK